MENNVFGDSIVSGMRNLSTSDTPARYSDPRSAIQHAPTRPTTSAPPSSRVNDQHLNRAQSSRHSASAHSMHHVSPLYRNERNIPKENRYSRLPFCVYCRRLGHGKDSCERLQAKHRRQDRFHKYRLQQNTPTEYGFLNDEARNARFNEDDDFGGGLGGIARSGATSGGMKIYIIGGQAG